MSCLFGAAPGNHEGDELLFAAESLGVEQGLALVSLTFHGDVGRVLNRDGASVPVVGGFMLCLTSGWELAGVVDKPKNDLEAAASVLKSDENKDPVKGVIFVSSSSSGWMELEAMDSSGSG